MRLLPALRRDLDVMPSPVADRPGLVIRDSFGYSDGAIIVPPLLAKCLSCFDGKHTDGDLRHLLVRLTGELEVTPVMTSLIEALSSNAFLEDEVFLACREAKHREFAEAIVRQPVHAGSSYPEEIEPLTATMRRYLGDQPGETPGTTSFAIAAPHVSPEGGWQSYRAAYRELNQADGDCTFVVLGTSHYGQSNRFGLTRKPYNTPLGTTRTHERIVNELAHNEAVCMEDYCHAVEHSIEFQVLFLQWLYGPEVQVVPILCGPFFPSLLSGGLPEDDDHVRTFFHSLGEIAAREGNHLRWVMGVDMAHQGRRYGDRIPAIAHTDTMCEVTARDHQRIERMLAGDAQGFWTLVRENQDDLRWCGSAPIYTFMKAVPEARGTLHHYEQWNIDDASVVSFAGISFAR